jgi:hypothetical protein
MFPFIKRWDIKFKETDTGGWISRHALSEKLYKATDHASSAEYAAFISYIIIAVS